MPQLHGSARRSGLASACGGGIRAALRKFVVALLLASLALALDLTCPGAAAAEGAGAAGEADVPRIALLGDPQIGYGVGGPHADQERLLAVVRRINQLKPGLVIIPGDLTQDRSFFQLRAFRAALDELQGEYLLVPGNHDVTSPADLRAYRENFGADYWVRQVGGFSFIGINSETARSPDLSAVEYERQWQFITDALTKPTNAEQGVILVTHRPPFVKQETEPESGANWPPEERARLLSLARAAGVKLILAGHLHRDSDRSTQDGIRIVALAGTARAFDNSPIGYSVLSLERDELGLRRVIAGPPPPVPYSVPGLREWTPRLFDFSIKHWVLTLLYAYAALSCYSAARTLRSPDSRAPLRALSFGLAFFALNFQLDLDEALRESGRILAKLAGVSSYRHLITGSLLLAFLVVCLIWFLLRVPRSGISRAGTICLAASLAPTLWFILSTISHHDIGMVLPAPVWDLLQGAAALLIVALTRRRSRGG